MKKRTLLDEYKVNQKALIIVQVFSFVFWVTLSTIAFIKYKDTEIWWYGFTGLGIELLSFIVGFFVYRNNKKWIKKLEQDQQKQVLDESKNYK